MMYVLITLGSVGVLLFVISFFMNDRMKDMENQLEQMSLTMMQDNYQLKQKMKVLEEELLAENVTEEILKQPYKHQKPKKQPLLVQTVQSMYQKGYKTHYIAKHTSLSEHDVHSIIQQFKMAEVKP